MYYGIYQNLRNSTWQCFLDFHIRSLPIDLLRISRAVDVPIIPNSRVGELLPHELGKTYCDGKHWVIIYDDTLPLKRARFVVAHELGHYLLGHNVSFTKYAANATASGRSPAERQADHFAARLLCPACVLWGLGVQTPEEIEALCLVEAKVARQRFRRMQTLYARNCFLQDPLEKQVYEQFLPYIQATKEQFGAK